MRVDEGLRLMVAVVRRGREGSGEPRGSYQAVQTPATP